MSSEIFTSQWVKLTSPDRKTALNQFVGGTDLHIIYLDDESSIIDIVTEKITDLGFIAFGTTDPNRALDYIQRHRSTLAMVISDFKMPEMDGFKFRQKVLAIAPEIPFAILSGFVDREMALKGMELKIAAYINKPIDNDGLFETISKECTPRIITIREEQELLKGFTDDATNLIEQVEDLTLELEENPNNHESIAKIFGMIHTIKGSSGFFEPRTLHTFAHRFEDGLKEVQGGSAALTPQLISVWLKACDVLKTLIEEFKTGVHNSYDIEELTKILRPAANASGISLGSTAPTASATDGTDLHQTNIQRQKGPQELKVAVSLLDEFMQISGEMTVIRNMINKIVRSIEKQYPADKDVALLSELLGELHKVNSSVQAKITEIRKVPVKSVVKPLSRIVRDTAQALKKEVELKITGEEIRIDNSVAEVLSNSLIHLVRNSLDHGVELPVDRANSGKPSRGEVTITTRVIGETILVEIQDDGKGINPDAIRKKLVSNGTHSIDQVNKMSLPDLYQMIFSAGFSTAQQITDISGRGVGMSMVKDVVEAIGGHILIESQLGKGTKFTLNIPIPKSVLITNCLFVVSQNMQFGVPQDQIQRVINVEEAQLRNYIDYVEGATILRINDELLPIVSLSHILGGDFRASPSNLSSGYLIILDVSHRQFCLWVDTVLDVEDTVVKAITAGQIKNLGLYLGATFLGDGAIGLILNVEGLAQKTGVLTDQRIEKIRNAKMAANEAILNNQYKLNVVLCELANHSQYAIPQEAVYRLEEFNTDQIENTGQFVVTPYRNRMLTFVDLAQFMGNRKDYTPQLESNSTLPTLVIQYKTGFIGLIVHRVLDLVTSYSPPEEGTVNQPGCGGWLIFGDRSVVLIDVAELINLITGGSAEPQRDLSA